MLLRRLPVELLHLNRRTGKEKVAIEGRLKGLLVGGCAMERTAKDGFCRRIKLVIITEESCRWVVVSKVASILKERRVGLLV